MNSNKDQRRRFVLAAFLATFAIVGLTACDADHYYAIFGNPAPSQTGPDCAIYCVSSRSVMTSSQIDVKQGETVRFFNLAKNDDSDAKTTVFIELVYRYPDATGISKNFSIREGKSKKIKIKKNLPVGTEIRVLYYVDNRPPHGGPKMIVQPVSSGGSS